MINDTLRASPASLRLFISNFEKGERQKIEDRGREEAARRAKRKEEEEEHTPSVAPLTVLPTPSPRPETVVPTVSWSQE